MKELIEIQSELKAPKNQFNKFGNYSYRSCEDILEAVKPLLKKHKCFLTVSDDIIEIGNSIFLKAIATLKNEKDEVNVTAFAKHPEQQKGMSDSQITGSSSSYARKYALNGLFLIDDTKDHDTPEDKVEKEERAEDSKPWLNKTDKDFEAIKKAIQSGQRTMAQLRGKYKVSKEVEGLLTA